MAVNGIFQNGVWSCGFDFLANGALSAGNVVDLSSNANVGSAYARFSGKGLDLTSGNPANYVARSFGVNLTQVITGWAFLTTSLPVSGLYCIGTVYDTSANAAQFSIGLNSSGQLGFYAGGMGSIGAQLGGSVLTGVSIVVNAWNYLELWPVIGAGGSIILRLNGQPILTFNGNTNLSGGGAVGRIYIGAAVNSGTVPSVYVDDWYMLDTTGVSPLNSFLGSVRIQTDGPNAESATSGLNTWSFTSPQGTDWGNFANFSPNTADYNSSNTVGARASCKFPALSGISRVYFFNCWEQDELDASGSRSIQVVYRNNSVDQAGPSITPSNASYVYHSTASVTDPNTGGPWATGLVTNSNNLEIGPQVTS